MKNKNEPKYIVINWECGGAAGWQLASSCLGKMIFLSLYFHFLPPDSDIDEPAECR